jgi:hypothetical protein
MGRFSGHGFSGNVKLMFKRGDHFQSLLVLQNCSLLTIFCLGFHLLFLLPASEEVMENPADLIQRLLEIQSGGNHRSPELIAEDERLIERLRNQAAKSTQTVKLSPDNLS